MSVKDKTSSIRISSLQAPLNGTQLNYYFICKRKLWLYSHGISFENSSELVKIGKTIHKETFKRKKKEIRIDNIVIDHIENGAIYEIKKSDSIQDAHIFQILYYIYCLQKLGINVTGMLSYPKQKKATQSCSN